MTEQIQEAIKNFELYKEKLKQHALTTALRVSDDYGEFMFNELIHADYDPAQKICVYLDTIERVEKVIEFTKKETPKKELIPCSCGKGYKMKIENGKLLCAYCGKEIEEEIKK